MSISILSHTHRAFSDAIVLACGKGNAHAGLLYEEFYKFGTLKEESSSFVNSRPLFESIKNLVNFSPLDLAEEYNDGATGKVLFKTHDGLEIESVLIPMQAGGTLCVSSQVGCRMGCAFCETGRMGLLRNLTVAEIISQVFVARHKLKFPIRNIVFMGMGEPFDNYDNVMQAVKILCDPKGFGFGSRHIAISTSGCVDGIYKLIAEGEHAPNLAVSVNATTDEERNKLMPVNKQYNMQKLHEAMQAYCLATKREILVAYVLLNGLNDTLSHADRLVHYVKGLNVKINLIPYNPQSKDRFSAPSDEVVDAFSAHLRDLGCRNFIRRSKGQKIMAACGQLGNIKLRVLRKDFL